MVDEARGEAGGYAVRHAEPGDYEAVTRVFAGPRAVFGTMQLPFPSAERWRKRFADPQDGVYSLVACLDDEVVGNLALSTFPSHPRRRHVGQIGMAVRDDHQGRGVGTLLMRSAIELADRWLDLRRLELSVYVDNEPAKRLYAAFGFEIEGTASAFAFRDGEFVDAQMMARVRRG